MFRCENGELTGTPGLVTIVVSARTSVSTEFITHF